MAVDKLVDSTALDTSLAAIADAIRAKTGGSSQIVFPTQFVYEIGNIPSGGGGNPSGTVTPTSRIKTYNFTAPNCTYFAIVPVSAPDLTTGKSFFAGGAGVAGRLYGVRASNAGNSYAGAVNPEMSLSRNGDDFVLTASSNADTGKVLQVGCTYSWIAW